MKLSHMITLPLLFFFFLISPTCSISSGLRIDLSHVDYQANFTKLELVQRAARRSHHRMSRLVSKALKATSSINEAQAPIHAGEGEFLMDLAIGTPAKSFSLIVDSGSDLIWTQCKPCVQCFSQPTPIFDPSSSSTYAKLECSDDLCQALPRSSCASDCEYIYSYGDSSSTQGVLAAETFTFGSKNPVSVPHIGFGCGGTNQGGGFTQGSGLVGLGRGPLSLISQLGFAKFSYCLTSMDESKKSLLLFGSQAELNGSAVQSTPLIKNPSQPSFYYISLKGITVGDTLLNIPNSTFELQEDGTGGLIIDSGTSITYLEVAAYKLVKKAFISQVKLPVGDGSDVGLDLCFSLPSSSSSSTTVDVPKLIFHFDGADVDLPPENYLTVDSGLLCLTVQGSNGMSIFGNFQQQNMQVLYDVEREMLSFMPTQCDQL